MFPPELVALTRHDMVRALPPALFEQILTQHLYRYLDFTTKLELLVVNKTVLAIANGGVDLHLPDEMVFDAYKIYCDEAYHALFSADLIRQVHARTGLPPQLDERPYFLTQLRRLQESVEPQLRALVELLFVVCSETLISATLAEVPDDPRVDTAVRRSIRDHAADERRHHAYFAAFLKFLWYEMDSGQRRAMARLLPDLLLAFLRPDLPAIRCELAGYGFNRDQIEQILAEVYDDGTVNAYARDTSRQTMRYFAAVGVLEDQAACNRFAELGLLEEGR
ncbi:P-aminobenzoate N-oxygenase AurF [Micromonospora matsumotoense]|uniref:p-aminobenzoate N-oxygenase AurF n=2 Tax=Micromonospora matsumotoense TaxID=121616 RepID=A0A1C4YVP0_9ACTN|nr:P-aminobenzoate N-oxygenase AurF [Micromonospora matsumotoense]